MRSTIGLVIVAAIACVVTIQPARAGLSLGTGNASLIGGDLSDPTDTVELSCDPGQGKPEEEMIPKNAKWVKMTCSPVSGPYAIPHQRHPYQSWVGCPAAGIFMNKPEQTKWYVDFKEGGYGGPSKDDPYYCAIELKDAFVLTHFTITTGGPDMPDRDPKQWAIQGSNTGDEEDWTDIYVCNATNRSGTLFKGTPFETFLFTSFDSAGMAKAVTPADAKKLEAKLKDKKLEKADFARSAKAYTHFRVAIYSCFNPSAVNWIYKNTSGSLHLGQLELFGVPGVKETVTKVVKQEEPVVPPSLDAPFIISYWCGPSQEQTNLERMKEIAECGFNVAQAPDLWEPASEAQVKFNLKFLDLCQQAGIKAFIFDGRVWKDGDWALSNPADIPKIEKNLDEMIANYSKHPALMGYVLGDEMGYGSHPRLKLLNQYLLKKDPTHLPYYNNLPNYASSPKAYEREIKVFLKTVKPALFSWDAYWQMHEENELRYYFDNLEVVRRNCLKAKTPFNQIIVSLCHMGYRECSEGDLRWQVWTSLAYGSRGIQYFTYVHVPGGMTTGDSPGLLAKDMTRDRKWFYVQKINQHIAKLGPTLIKLTSTGVYHTDPPVGTIPLLPEAPVKKIDGGSMVVGCFKDAAGKVYILPVNKSMNEARTFTLTLDDKMVSTSEVSQETGVLLAAAPLKDKVLEVKLEAGEGRLFSLNTR